MCYSTYYFLFSWIQKNLQDMFLFYMLQFFEIKILWSDTQSKAIISIRRAWLDHLWLKFLYCFILANSASKERQANSCQTTVQNITQNPSQRFSYAQSFHGRFLFWDWDHQLVNMLYFLIVFKKWPLLLCNFININICGCKENKVKKGQLLQMKDACFLNFLNVTHTAPYLNKRN